MSRRFLMLVTSALVLATILGACAPAPAAPAAQATQVPAQPTAEPTQAPAEPTKAPEPTQAPPEPTKAPEPTAVPAPTTAAEPAKLILATTTSTADSGLLDYILPDFEKKFNAAVDVIAVGTGQALEIGTKGDADVVLVHSRKGEDQFVADGHAKERFDVMYNDYIVVGPKTDPAKVMGMATGKEAFKAIMDAGQPFVSRGDKSGTNTKELSIWSSIAVTPTKEMTWYNSIGQGMGDTLLFAEEKQGYTLADRGTYLAMSDKLPGLDVMVGGGNLAENKDKALLNPYGVLAVNPEKHPNVKAELAQQFVEWILSPDVQKMIGGYGVDKFGQPLFYASAKPAEAASGDKAAVATGGAALKITGKVGSEQAWSEEQIKALPVTEVESTNSKGAKEKYTGIKLTELLAQAAPAADAKTVVFVADDGYTAEAPLADVLACGNCIVSFRSNGGFSTVLPDFAKGLQVKGVVEINLK